MTPELEAMLKKYADNIAPGNKLLVRWAERFLEYNRGDFTRKGVEKYLNHLRSEGYADGTIHFVFGMIRRFFRVNGLEWPYRKGEGPVVNELSVFAPALSPTVVKKMIETAKKGYLEKDEAAYLALSTTYGLRLIEMATLTRERIDFNAGLIFIETAKHGRQRWHLVPPEIRPYLEAYDFSHHSRTHIEKAFYKIEKKSGFQRMKEVNWHSIRRILNRLLVDAGLPLPTVNDFLRWKRSDQTMIARYYSVPIVGPEIETGIARSDREIDEQVFAVHPFLPIWRGENDG